VLAPSAAQEEQRERLAGKVAAARGLLARRRGEIEAAKEEARRLAAERKRLKEEAEAERRRLLAEQIARRAAEEAAKRAALLGDAVVVAKKRPRAKQQLELKVLETYVKKEPAQPPPHPPLQELKVTETYVKPALPLAGRPLAAAPNWEVGADYADPRPPPALDSMLAPRRLGKGTATPAGSQSARRPSTRALLGGGQMKVRRRRASLGMVLAGALALPVSKVGGKGGGFVPPPKELVRAVVSRDGEWCALPRHGALFVYVSARGAERMRSTPPGGPAPARSPRKGRWAGGGVSPGPVAGSGRRKQRAGRRGCIAGCRRCAVALDIWRVPAACVLTFCLFSCTGAGG
jgi:hypothetical protein